MLLSNNSSQGSFLENSALRFHNSACIKYDVICTCFRRYYMRAALKLNTNNIQAVTSQFRFNFTLRRILLQRYDEMKREEQIQPPRTHCSRYNRWRERNDSKSNGLEEEEQSLLWTPHSGPRRENRAKKCGFRRKCWNFHYPALHNRKGNGSTRTNLKNLESSPENN